MNSNLNSNLKEIGLIFVGIFLTSVVFLMFEIVLTKVFSIMFYYHFAFLVVSIALIGIGASSLLVYLFPNVFQKKKFSVQITFFSSLLAVSIPLVMYFLLNLNPDILRNKVLVVLASSVISTIPFLLGGFIFALIFFHRSESFSRFYFSNLTGAGIGCGLVVFLLDTIGGLNTILVISSLAALAAVLFSFVEKGRKWIVATVIILLCLVILFPVNQRFKIFKIQSHYKGGGESKHQIQYEKWTSLFRTTLSGIESPMKNFMIFNDGVGGGPVFQFDGNFDKVQFLKGSIREMAFHLRPFDRSLILGSGGGESVLTALLFGNKHITGIEINPVTVHIVKDKLASYSGGIYSRPEVNIVIDEARSFVHRSKEQYDLIHLSLVDSFAATLAGAFTFTESNLYSVEAFVDYFRHLTDDGILSVTRVLLRPESEGKYFEAMRMIAIAADALEKEGIKDIRPHIIIAGGSFFPFQQKSSGINQDRLFTFMLKKTPFRNDEVDKMRNVCHKRGFHLIATPSDLWHPFIKELYEGSGRGAYIEQIRRRIGIDISPTTDERPFFFNVVRPVDSLWRVLTGKRTFDRASLVLIYLLVTVMLVFILLFVLPLFMRGRWTSPTRIKVTILTYFACLGIAFMLVEITLMQKLTLFLGHPTYSLSVVLFSLLVFSGVGSSLTGYIPTERLSYYLARILLVLPLYLLITVIVLPKLFALCFDLSQWVRFVLAVGIISPLALFMGMPFPIAIRIYDRTEHEMIPWVWGINGIATVLGSVGAVFLAISYGFTVTLLTGVGTYILALFFSTVGSRLEIRY